jgi:hypothetical protein
MPPCGKTPTLMHTVIHYRPYSPTLMHIVRHLMPIPPTLMQNREPCYNPYLRPHIIQPKKLLRYDWNECPLNFNRPCRAYCKPSEIEKLETKNGDLATDEEPTISSGNVLECRSLLSIESGRNAI